MKTNQEHGGAGPLKAVLTVLTTVSTIIGIIVFLTGKTNVPALLGLRGAGGQGGSLTAEVTQAPATPASALAQAVTGPQNEIAAASSATAPASLPLPASNPGPAPSASPDSSLLPLPSPTPASAPSASPASSLPPLPSPTPASAPLAFSTLTPAPSTPSAPGLTPAPLLLPSTGAPAVTPPATQAGSTGAMPALSPTAAASSLSPGMMPAPAPAANGVWQQDGLLAEVKFSQIQDTGFSLSFKITNEGTNDLVATYSPENFSAVDDTGTTYPPDNPAPPRTLTVAAQNSDEEYVSFGGALNPRARQLNVTLAQLAGVQNITLALPIGSDVADVKTAAGFVQVFSQGFGLSFKMTNEGSGDFVARYRREDFSAVDDTGQTYTLDNPPGERTILIASDSSDNEELSFEGALNPRARRLTLALAQLSGTENITLTLPIGSDVADVRAKASIVETWNNGFALSFMLINEGPNDFVARYRLEDFNVLDDTGQAYALENPPGTRVYSISTNSSETDQLSFQGPINPAARQLSLTLAQLSGTPDIKVMIPVNH